MNLTENETRKIASICLERIDDYWEDKQDRQQPSRTFLPPPRVFNPLSMHMGSMDDWQSSSVLFDDPPPPHHLRQPDQRNASTTLSSNFADRTTEKGSKEDEDLFA